MARFATNAANLLQSQQQYGMQHWSGLLAVSIPHALHPCERGTTVQEREQHKMLRKTRQHQETAAFHLEYAQCAGVERLMSHGVRAFDLLTSRYMGQGRTQLQHILTAVAINVVRLVAWWQHPQPAPARRSVFAS